EKIVFERPELKRYFAAIGGFGGSDVNTGFIFLSLVPKKERAADPASGKVLTQQQLADVLRGQFKQVKDIKAYVQDPSLGGFGGGRNYPIDFSLHGPDWDKLGELTNKFMDEMKKTDLMVDVDTNLLRGMPEVRVIPDRVKAKDRGVSLL